uniref:ABC transporter ATP-binding protein n=1 Tax=Pseudomonas bambusae TaxID=3139142 RepID=UPI004038C954
MSYELEACPSRLFELHSVSQQYVRGNATLCALDTIDFTLDHGDTCAIVGASGSGKSTLLNILGLLERPIRGSARFVGNDIVAASANDLAAWRNRHIGFIFQAFNLLPRLSALDNVALPLAYRNVRRKSARALALAQLQAVGLADRAEHRPADLSGGQRQRVAIARALVGQPSLILADEPTGNLDPCCANEILELFLALNREQGATLVMVTHDANLAARFERKVEVAQGRVYERVGHVAV